MESKTYFIFLCMFLPYFLISSSQAYAFYVGGRDGWVIKPSESYDHWAQRNRFQVNDTLVFKYNSGTDSVLAVSKQNFDTCSISNPLLKLDGGDSRYKLGNSGPFYFISGNQTNCQKGQKLILIVLSPRIKTPPTPTATPPSPAPSISPSTAPASPPSIQPAANPPSSATPPSSSTTPSSPPAPAPQGAASPPTGGTPNDGSAAPSGDSGQSPPPKPSSSTMLTSSMGFTLGCSLLITMAPVGIF